MRANDCGNANGPLMSGFSRIRLLTLFVLLSGVLSLWSACHSNCLGIKRCIRPGDFWMRHNEICCSHEGVNPFDVWNRTVVHPKYKGHEHPPFPDDTSDKLVVHAYPPWHTAFMWWMGYVSYPRAVSVLFFAFGIAAWGMIGFIKRRQPMTRDLQFLYWSLCLGTIIVPLYFCFIFGNYGLLITALMMVLFTSMERRGVGWDLLGGMALSLMMVKPQMGALFAMPLLFSKRFVMLGISGAICLGATAWTATAYHQSMIDLLLQVPQIGAPWVGPRFWPPLKVCHYPVLLQRVEMLLSVILCGVGCYWTRGIKEKWIASIPAVLLFPIWTYSNVYDGIGEVFVWMLVALALTGMVESITERMRRRLGYLLVGMLGLSIIQSLIVGFGDCFSAPVRLWQAKEIALYLISNAILLAKVTLTAVCLSLRLKSDC